MFKIITFILLIFSHSQSVLSTPVCGIPITDESYYKLENRPYPLNNEQEALLNDVSDMLRGHWHGELVQIECKGTLKEPIKATNSSKVRLEFRQINTNQELRMRTELDFKDSGKKLIYNRLLFERRAIHSFISNGPNIMILTEKNRQVGLRFGTTLVETIYKLIFKKDSLQLDIITHTNGYFSIEERWSLNRR